MNKSEHRLNEESINVLYDRRPDEMEKCMEKIFAFYSVMNKSRYVKDDTIKEKFDRALYEASEALRKMNMLAEEENLPLVFEYEKHSCYLCLVNYYNMLAKNVLEKEQN